MEAKLKRLLQAAPRSFSWLLFHLHTDPTTLLDALHRVGAEEHYGLWRLGETRALPAPTDQEVDLSRLLTRLKSMERQNQELRKINTALAQENEALKKRVQTPVWSNDEELPDWPLMQLGNEERVAICLWSDWHWGERVADRSFDPNIAQRRVVRLLSLMQKEWNQAKVNYLYLGLLGDFITGSIHEENRELGGNTLTPTQEIYQVGRTLAWGIQQILNHFHGLEKLVVVCVHGNHGRLTRYPRITSGHLHSLESLLYWQLANTFSQQRRARFLVANQPHVYTKVLGLTLRWCHGDLTRASSISALHKWVEKQNHIEPADLTLVGHFHHLYCADGLAVNGSLVGSTDYGKLLGFAEPPQHLFLLLDRHGIAQVTRLLLQD